jgi:hypothetical protein
VSQTPVVLRTTWTTYAAYLPVVFIAAALVLLTPSAGLMRPLVDVVVAFWLASLLVRLPFVLRMRVELAPEALVVLDRHRWQIAWSDITDISVIPNGRLGTASLFVNDAAGSHELFAVRAFWPWQRARLERQRVLVSQWWQASGRVAQPSV